MFIKFRKSSSIFKKVHRIFKKTVNRRLDGPAHLRTPQAPVNKMHVNWRLWRQIGNSLHLFFVLHSRNGKRQRARAPKRLNNSKHITANLRWCRAVCRHRTCKLNSTALTSDDDGRHGISYLAPQAPVNVHFVN